MPVPIRPSRPTRLKIAAVLSVLVAVTGLV